MITFETHETEKWVLTEEGAEIAANGSHEKKVFDAIPVGGISIKDLEVRLFFYSVVFLIFLIETITV